MAQQTNLTFLGSEYPQSPPEQALFHIIPVPFEKSVSYGGGTSQGPLAIIEASQELEAFDGISCPGGRGIHTAPAMIRESAEHLVGSVATAVNTVIKTGSIPIVLGGEHTVSVGAFKALKEASLDVGIIQFDAHADLRDSYQGTPYSHACVMHRALDMGIPFVQIGVRSLSYQEQMLRDEQKICYFDARQIADSGADCVHLPDDFPDTVYITFDVDAMDPSIMPATGTPEPGGLLWYDTMTVLEHILESRHVIGFDVVELAPVPNLHAPNFTVARLIYNLMGFIERRHQK